MAKAPVIQMPDSVKEKSLQYREGYIAYYTGQPKNANPYQGQEATFSAQYEADWNNGWMFAHSGGTPGELAHPTKFELHLRAHASYENRAYQIIKTLEEQQGFFTDNCPHGCSFNTFTCDPKDGKITLEASTWWISEDFVRTVTVPLVWFDTDTLDVQAVKAWAAEEIVRQAEAAREKSEKEAADKANRKREADLAQLKALASAYPAEVANITAK